MGNPSTFTQALADDICQRLGEGETLTAICREEGMPARRTVSDWRRLHPEFAQAYDEAMLQGCHALLDETLAIADDSSRDYTAGKDGAEVLDSEHVQRSKLRIWARHELIKRKRPDMFSDKLLHGGDPNNPVQTVTRIEIVAVEPKPE
jgi:transposase-like protein